MLKIIALSYIFLAISSALMLKARKFTKLYPLAFVSTLMFTLAAVNTEYQAYLDMIASICMYVVVFTAVKNGFLTYKGFKAPFFEKKITAIGLILLAVGVILGQIPHKCFYICGFRSFLTIIVARIVLANTFAILALSRERTPVRVGDYEVLMLASFLILADGAIDMTLYIAADVLLNANIDPTLVMLIDVHLLYTASLLFMLTMLRR